jgi:hypothetical protein
MQDIGVAGMVRTALFIERATGLEVLNIGRAPNDYLAKEDCVMELAGNALFYRISLRGGWIWIGACGLDEGDRPPGLFNLGDGPDGWTVVRRFILALERSGITSLKEQAAPHRIRFRS